MLASQLYAPTLREVPAEAEIPSHQLMLRAGLLRKSAGGIYTYLPLAWRVLRNIEQIVREEMDAAGAQELLMPIVQPAEIWQETGRWDVYGDEMFRLQDRHGRDFCLGPTHEELITSLVKMDVRSYRQLPLTLYQIQNKYRDEIRPRFGVMRGREFIMKDAYSFDRSEEDLHVSYMKMYQAYSQVAKRCGLTCRPVEADSGAIGGSGSHEFMVLAPTGEDGVAYCTACDYAANVEKAELQPISSVKEELLVPEIVPTPGAKTIQEISNFLQVPAEKMIKTLAYQTENRMVLALIRGDHELNEIKLKNILDCQSLEMASEAEIERSGSSAGFLGPVGMKGSMIVADPTVMKLHNAVCGANQVDAHMINVNAGRDFRPDHITDLRLVQEDDPCPRCGKPMKLARGIEIGHIFKLRTKYSQALRATYLDEQGKEQPFVMGCYGIGISRIMGAAIEEHNDKDGIVWPPALAPYQVVVVPINYKEEDQQKLATEIYQKLSARHYQVVLDDRNERPGVKFKDADLIGYPLRITVGPKSFQEQVLEVKKRATGEVVFLPLVDYEEKLVQLLQEMGI